MFASTLFADDHDVRDFDQQIQNLMRNGRVDEAAAVLETTLRVLWRAGHIMAGRCLACAVEDIHITGWDQLEERIAKLDRPGAPITALGIDISWPGHIGLEPDERGTLEPYLETNYYDDSAFPFTGAGRTALLQGYTTCGTNWQGGMVDIDGVIGVKGLGRVYGMVYSLVENVRATSEPDPLDADAMRLGAAFVAVRLHQAVARAIDLHGLPRPLAVLVGSNESYPFYDAPVLSSADAHGRVRAEPEIEVAGCENASNCAVTLNKRPAQGIVPQPDARQVQAQSESDHDDSDHGDTVVQISGAALRQRLGKQQVVEPAAIEAAVNGGLLRRLFAR